MATPVLCVMPKLRSITGVKPLISLLSDAVPCGGTFYLSLRTRLGPHIAIIVARFNGKRGRGKRVNLSEERMKEEAGDLLAGRMKTDGTVNLAAVGI